MLHNNAPPWDIILSIGYTKGNRLIAAAVQAKFTLSWWSGESVKFNTTFLFFFYFFSLSFSEAAHFTSVSQKGSRTSMSYSWRPPLKHRSLLKSAQTFIVSPLFERFGLTDGDTHHLHPLFSPILQPPVLSQEPACEIRQRYVQTSPSGSVNLHVCIMYIFMCRMQRGEVQSVQF